MSDLLQATLAIAAASLVPFIWTYQKAVLGPTLGLRRAIADTRLKLSLHASTIHTPMSRERLEEAQEALKGAASELFAALDLIPRSPIGSPHQLGLLPPRRDVAAAARHLRTLATHMPQDGMQPNQSVEHVNRVVARIEKLLRLKPLT